MNHNIIPDLINDNLPSFLHEATTSDSKQFIRLLKKGGLRFYGFYWIVMESLRLENSLRLSDDDFILIGEKHDIFGDELLDFKACCENAKILVFKDGMIFSPDLDLKMKKLMLGRERRKNSGSLGGLASAKARKEKEQDIQVDSKQCSSTTQAIVGSAQALHNNKYNNNYNNKSNTNTKDLDQDLNTNSELARGQAQFEELDFSKMPKVAIEPESAFIAFELSEKAKNFASKLKIDLEPKKVEEVPKVDMVEVIPPSENEQNEEKTKNETEKTTESICPPADNGLMAKFGSFDLPEDLQKFAKAVEAELDTPDGSKKWELSSQFILAGRRPVRKYLDIWFSPIELAQVAAEYDKNGVLKEMKTALRLVQTRLDDLKAQNKNTEFKGFTGWMLGFILNDLLDKKIKKNILEKQEARK